jgi:purine-binding chemotaxis protein CheW
MTSMATIEGGGAAVASPAGRPADGADVAQYLTFMLGSEQFALGILSIKEIIEFGHITVVPMMPAWIRGVINLRGAVVPVLDLSVRFGRKAAEVTRRTCVVIVEVNAGGERHDIGVMVDAVNAVLDIARADIEPTPEMGSRIRPEFIFGMGKVDGRFVIILDAERVLSENDLSIAAEAGVQAQAATVAKPRSA